MIAGVAGCGKLNRISCWLLALKGSPFELNLKYLGDISTMNKQGGVSTSYRGYTFENGCIVIPSDQYIDRDDIARNTNISIENRPDNIWELKEIQNIIVQPEIP